jgi:hypothetical protein
VWGDRTSAFPARREEVCVTIATRTAVLRESARILITSLSPPPPPTPRLSLRDTLLALESSHEGPTRHAESDPALLPPETVDGSKHPRKVAGVLELAEKVTSEVERVKGVAAAWAMTAERTTKAEEGRCGVMSIV